MEAASVSDADAIAEIEAREAEEFRRAVDAWRQERAAGGGAAVVREAGGAFARAEAGAGAGAEGTATTAKGTGTGTDTGAGVVDERKVSAADTAGEGDEVRRHYDKHLAAYYEWLAGDFEALCEEQRAFFAAKHIVPLARGTASRALAVDLGAGHGIHSIALAELGFHVKAVDFSRQLLDALGARAGQRGLEVEAWLDDIRNVGALVDIGSADVMLCMTDTIAHLASFDEVEIFILQCWSALRPGGKLVLSFRDYCVAFKGADRFIPVRSDDSRIATCILEYDDNEDTYVTVTDQLYDRGEDGAWTQHVSSYRKLRVTEKTIERCLERCGFSISSKDTIRRMLYVIAEKR
jgi:SAM-dependent methyltransferase